MTDQELLAGLSFITILNLKDIDKDISEVVTYSGPNEEGKYRGMITTLNYRPVVTTQFTFETSDDAVNHMWEVVAAAKRN